MNNSCTFAGNPVLKSLQRACGTDVAAYLDYFSKAFKSNPQAEELEIRKEFGKWYKDTYKKELDLKSITSVALKNAIIKYFDDVVPTVNATNININSVKSAILGYNSSNARKTMLKYMTVLIYKDYIEQEAALDKVDYNLLSEVATDRIKYLRRYVFQLLEPTVTNISREELWQNLGNNCGEFIDKLIKEKKGEPYSDATLNWLALYREFTTTFKEDANAKSKRDEAFDEILNSKLITSLALSRYDSFSDVEDANNVSLEEVEKEDGYDEEEAGNEDKFDGSIRDYNTHDGEFSDFKKHLSERVKIILNTIPKLNTPVKKVDNSSETPTAEQTTLDLKINPTIGCPEYHDSTELATMLYCFCVKDDAETLAQSVRTISETFPEYAGLSILANMLQNDRDLRYHFYTNFGKHIVSKAQTVLNDGIVTYRISNPNASRLEILKAQYRNDFITSSINANIADVKNDFEKITNFTAKGRRTRPTSQKTGNKTPLILLSIENEVGRTPKVEQAIGKLYDILKVFYPSLDKNSLLAFVCNNPNMNIQTAMAALYDDCKAIVGDAKDDYTPDKKPDIGIAEQMQLAIKSKQDRLRQAREHNRRLFKENMTKKANHPASDFIDVDSIKNEEPITPDMLSAPISFAEKMLRYALVKANINSVNVHGNQSSDVLNSSLITRLKAIFENPERGKDSPLQLLAEDYHLDTNTQFRLSNILIEQDDHPGIFRKVNGKFVPTDYANDLLQFTLFNGAINQDSQIPVLYSEMSKGDYIGTSWANFFSDVDSVVAGKNIKLGRYFLRIPSDAPKTFIVRAPRYVINNDNQLFSTGNQSEYDSFINSVVNRLTENNVNVPLETFIPIFYNDKLEIKSANDLAKQGIVMLSDEKEFIDAILSTGERGINVMKLAGGDELAKAKIVKNIENTVDKNSEENTITFAYKESNGRITAFTIKGKYKAGYIYNAKMDEIINADDFVKESLRSKLSNYYNDEFISVGKVSYKDLSVTRVRIVNKNHQLFRQLRNAFKQELLDGVAAARLMFETDVLRDKDKNPILVNGKEVYCINRDDSLAPVLKQKWAADMNGLSPIYHFRGEAYENGKLTGRVFESDRFIIFDNNDNVVRNYGQELLDSAINYLQSTKDDTKENLLVWTEDKDAGTYDIELTSRQENYIDAKIEEYINDFVDNSYERIQEYKDFTRGRRISIDNVADYMLNHQLMYINSNELLEGDTKYYKDPQTFLKRTKEYQASGVPYGISSIRRTLTSSPLDKITVGNPDWGITLTDRFNAVTFHTTKKFKDSVLKSLEKTLTNKDVMGDRVMSKAEAHTLMYGIDGKGGYTDAKVNDAQSYITFEEWVRRVAARGELDRYTPLINKIVNRETLTREDLTEFIQVQKNVYYDMYYDKITGRVVPRQIKNAEFVLVPQFIEGTELMEVYKFMKDNDIAQINTDETSKASNNYIIDIFDEHGVLKQEIIDSNNEKSLRSNDKKKRVTDFKQLVAKAIQPYSYNYLYEQQKTPQHMFANNKLAIQIAKKIIDNIQEGHPLYSEKIRYFDLLTTNIRQSFISLMQEFNIPIDDAGNLKATDYTVFENIDYQKFYDKLKVELGRLGIDDNSFDYATLTGNDFAPGETIMPNYFGIMINKLESIVQSLVTKSITRQTLHGFHAAQITNIGYVQLGHKDTIKKDKSLKYHPQGYYNPKTEKYATIEDYEKLTDKTGYEPATLPYIEVKLPYSAFGIDKNSAHYKDMTDEQIIEELKSKGLDQFIGYRIPTEGKQSIGVMKLAGFIPDGSGSTIVVPNEWVPQTGSDFDIDSVYGIMHKVRITPTGEVKKIEYKESFDRNDWYNYISRHIGGRIEGVTDDEYTAIKEKGNKEGKKEVAKYRKKRQKIEQKAYDKLPGEYFIDKETKKPVYIGPKGAIVKVHELANEQFGVEPSREKYIAQLGGELNILDLIDNSKFDEEERQAIKDYKTIIKNIYDSITGNTDTESKLYNETKSKVITSTIVEYKELQHEGYAKQAELNGLMSEEEYLAKANANPMDYNSRDARNNELVKIMIRIMSHPYSLEENLSRSKFDDITGNDNAAVDLLRNKVENERRKNRSPFNILDEAEFQEDAMQGFALKGFSVARDTFCSICNTVRPIIETSYAPVISYDYSQLSDKQFDAKLKELKERFDDANQQNVWNEGKIINIRHNKIGWSNKGDKNIDGRYITVYSSETTAHILDAMKSGPVPNVNKYTFGVYKTLVDLGSRYTTAVGFIMHPAVAVINKFYNRTNSIYANDVSTRYIESALNEYCDRLAAIKDSNVKFKKRATLQEKLDAVNKAFGTSIGLDYMKNNLTPISESDLALRINKPDEYRDKVGGEVNMIRSDMRHVLHFAKLLELTNNISSIQQVTNPDKFGAKQTIFETERVFKQISDYVKSKYTIEDKRLVNQSVLKVDGRDMLEAIYPDFVNVGLKNEDTFDDDLDRFVKSGVNVKNSKYPSLCAHLKYGSATSIVVNKAFFATQTPVFREFINSIEGYFSDSKRLDDKTYKLLRTYIINALFRRCAFINSPLHYVKNKGFRFKSKRTDSNNVAEYARIYGYSRTVNFEVPTGVDEETGEAIMTPVKIKKVNDPTKTEINLFAQLSPAQKIEFIKRNFRNKGSEENIFDYLNTRLYTTIATRNTSAGAQIINFTESSADIDYLRDLFFKAFTNTNPLIALAAADVIKYAFVVDGYQFSRNGVSKLIPNTLLLKDGPFAGTNIVPDMNEMMSQVSLYLTDDVLENFIRSHPNLTQINTRRVRKDGNMAELVPRMQDIIFISPNQEEEALKYNILQQDKKHFNHYVRLKFGNETILYRINPFETGYAVLTPLNELEYNENADWSANDEHNIYPGKVNGIDYFRELVEAYRTSRAPKERGVSVFNFENLIDETTVNNFKAVSYVVSKDAPVAEFNVKADSSLGRTIINRATEIINDPDKAYRFFYTLDLDRYLTDDNENILIASPVKTKTKNGETLGSPHIFNISKVDIASVYDYYKRPNASREHLTQKEKDILTSLEQEIQTRSISSTYSHMFEIEEFTENIGDKKVNAIKFSTKGHKTKPIVNATMSVIKGVNYMSRITQEQNVSRLSRSFNQQHIFAKETVAEAHVDDVIIPAAKAIEQAVEEITSSLDRFWEIPGKKNHYYKITDPEVIKEVKKNEALRERYLETIIRPYAIEKQFAIFRDLNIDSQDESLRPYLTKIKESVAKLRNIDKVKEARETYIDEVLDKLSTNPYIGGSINGRVAGGVISVVSGYYKQSTLNAMFNDIQEAPNALVQVTMKMVQGNLRATEMQIERDIEAFTSHVEDIKARAAAAGKSVDYDKIFDEYGRFRRKCTNQLLIDRNRLQDAVNESKRHWLEVRDSKPDNELSVESIKAYLDYQKAELEYNEWKAKYIEQEAYNEHNTKDNVEDDGYYNTKNKLAREMIYGKGTQYIYAVYQILRDKKNRLMRKQIDDVDNPALDEEIEDIITKMYHLTVEKIIDPVTHRQIDKDTALPSDDAEEMIKRVWNDAVASALLNDYITNNRRNERKYFKYAPKPQFEQQVRNNLAIVDQYEDRDENNIPRVSQAVLAKNKDYQKAKKWLRRNASSVLVERGDDSWLYEYQKALDVLHDTSEDISMEYHAIYRNKKYRDENGDLDGLEISKDAELVARIKKEQETNYKVFREDDYSDRKLISLAIPDDLVYTNDYWNEMLGLSEEDRRNSDLTKEYKETITTINNILSPYYSESTNTIDWGKMFENRKEEDVYKDLVALDALYTRLDEISKSTSRGKDKKEIGKWIEENCIIETNTDRYKNDLVTASMHSGRTASLFKKILKEHSKDDTEGNSYLYKTYKLKYAEDTEEYKKYVDIPKTKARRIVDQYTYKTNTKYYTIARNEALSKGKEAFRDWFFKNHVYNPYERKFEPIVIWRKTEYKYDVNSDIEREWAPEYLQQTRTVSDGYLTINDVISGKLEESSTGGRRKIVTDEDLELTKTYNENYDLTNKNYKEGFGHEENYKYGSNPIYDNPDNRNEFEIEMSEYMQGIETKLVEDEDSQHFIRHGYAPARLKGEGYSLKGFANEARKLAGFTYYANGKDEETPVIDYAHDKYIPTPMLGILKRTSTPNNLKKPIREECETEEEYIRKKQEWDKEEARVKAEELELRKELMDRDFEAVFKQFIARATKHNSIQHNKMNFYFAQQLLSDYGVYRQRYGKEGDYKKDGSISNEEQAEYMKQIDKDMYDQFTTTIQRFVNNEWKSPEGSLTRYMSMLQAMTSAKFMIFNHKGGIANVTYGQASITSEAFAGEFFSESESLQSFKIYGSGIIDYMAHAYSDKSSTLAGAIVKHMNVVDYDEQRGLSYIQTDLAEVSKRINDFAYSAQSAGEHAMQNRIMFALMLSHRTFLNPRSGEFGEPKYIYMNFNEYIQGLEESALMEFLTDEEKEDYKKFKEKVIADANKFKDYAWFRKDFVTEYTSRFDWARQSEFNRLKKEKIKDAKKEFYDDEAHPTIFSQLKLGSNGKLAFNKGSMLEEMDSMYGGKVDVNGTGPSDAFKFLANFKGRVISVNKKIHGAYDKSGRAKIENTWWGSVVMQYHKHLPIGFAKRYRSKGYYNEERGAVEKGSYVSIKDFISINVKRDQVELGLDDDQVDAIKGVQYLCKDFLDFVFHIKIAYDSMPEYDKANIWRAISDFGAMFSALFACVALKMAATDDDKHRWWYNFSLYQVDRLASESAQYMPWVIPSEAKKFFGNPIAGFKEVDDMLSSVSALTQMLMGTVGLSDFEPTYTSGVNSGRNKLAVYVERNIPFWRGIRSAYVDIYDNNKAYKVSKNVLGFVDTDKVAEKAKEIFE